MNTTLKTKLSPAELQRKYHQNLVFNYAEYPTCDHWDYNFRSEEYKKSLVEWLKKNPNENIFFYVHIFHFANNYAGFALVVSLSLKAMSLLRLIFLTCIKK